MPQQPSPVFSASVLSVCRSFDTKAGEWHDVQLPFEEFIPLFRAKTVQDGAKLDPSTVTSIQVSSNTIVHQQSDASVMLVWHRMDDMHRHK